MKLVSAKIGWNWLYTNLHFFLVFLQVINTISRNEIRSDLPFLSVSEGFWPHFLGSKI